MKRLAVISAILCMLTAASARVGVAGSAADRMAPCRPETTNATGQIDRKIVEGWVSIGHEVRTFKPCDRNEVLWLVGQSPAMKEIVAAYRQALPDGKAYQPLFLVLAGELVDPPAEGFGAEYENAFLATRLVRVARGESCDHDTPVNDPHAPNIGKITFDLSKLDEQGLYGPPGGKRALSYEFCIPGTAENKTKVEKIDPAVTFISQSPGRIGCGDNEFLCIGSTHQKDFAKVLQQLAELPYVEHIDQSNFE